MAFVWSRLALAALVASVASVAAPAAPSEAAAPCPCPVREPQLACAAADGAPLVCAWDEPGDAPPVAALFELPALPPRHAVATVAPAAPAGVTPRPVDVLPFAPKTSPPLGT